MNGDRPISETAQDRLGQKHEPKTNFSSGRHARSMLLGMVIKHRASICTFGYDRPHILSLDLTGLKVHDRRDEIFAYKSFNGVTTSRDAAWGALLTCQ